MLGSIARASLPSLCLITGIFAFSPAHAIDDTFDCLLRPTGTKITVWKDFGYSRYSNRVMTAGMKIDAQESQWKHEQYPTVRNKYPIMIGGNKDGCFAGGTVLGTSSLNATWTKLYNGGKNNSASIQWTGAAAMTVDGIRIHNTWDAVRPGQNAPNFIVKNVWVSRNRDDCIENDNANTGLITDSLFDGCYVFYSSAKNVSTVTIENTLARLQPLPGAHTDGPNLQPGHKAWIKGGPVNKISLHNNVFMQEQKGNVAVRAGGIPTLKADGTPSTKIVSCSNNVMVWTGPGEYPYYLQPGCFTVTKDRSVWDRARQNWINCHPKVRRIEGDPTPQPSNCDPGAPGGT
jgi:hypothetical protein